MENPSGSVWGPLGSGRSRAGHGPPMCSQTPAPTPARKDAGARVGQRWGQGHRQGSPLLSAPSAQGLCPAAQAMALPSRPKGRHRRGRGQGLGRWTWASRPQAREPARTPGGCWGTRAGGPPLPCSSSAGPWRPPGPGGGACRRAAPSFPLGPQAPGGLGTKGGLCPLWARSHPALPCRPRGRCLCLQPSKDPLASLQGPASRSPGRQPPARGLRALPRLSWPAIVPRGRFCGACPAHPPVQKLPAAGLWLTAV